MGLPGSAIDAWLRDGGLVVTASDRAARALANAFHRARRAENRTAWPAPNILSWNNFARSAWEQRAFIQNDPRQVLNPLQEQSLWVEIARDGQFAATPLENPRHRLAALAMDAHRLLCSYAPRQLKNANRTAWQRDAGSFSDWLAAFDEACTERGLLSPARLPVELASLLQSESTPRKPLLLAGFDRILPTQRAVLDAWGAWQEADLCAQATSLTFVAAATAQSELAACARWCSTRLAAHPEARILLITQDISQRRGEMERAFLSTFSGSAAAPPFEFSLGIPLSRVALPRAAHLVLRWLNSPLAEHELDWLFASGYAAPERETLALQAAMRRIRRRSQEQPTWTLPAFSAASQRLAASDPEQSATACLTRFAAARNQLANTARTRSPLEWAELVPQLLESLHFAAGNQLSSAEYQALGEWQQALESAGSLGFDGRRIPWPEFLSMLGRVLDETLFSPESRDAPIQIVGPAESAGLPADAIWFLGASEEAWPPKGSAHPFLPFDVQRQAGMPHATPHLDWELAAAITARLAASAPEVHFSYPRQKDGVESRPTRLVAQIAGPPQPLPGEPDLPPTPVAIAESVEDFTRIAFPLDQVRGGSGVLTSQSQCPFKAFATARLDAQGWSAAEAGLTAAQRGSLLHEVLHSIWRGAPEGIRSRSELGNIEDKISFTCNHVQRILQQKLSEEIRARMPRRYLELEAQRLVSLVAEWLEYEATRAEFMVRETEAKRAVRLAGLAFDVRLDRIDQLIDDTLLVIDYKSGNPTPKSWELPRPDDVQLPLYAGFALERAAEPLGGLVFAKVRRGNHEFVGRVFNAASTLLPDLGRTTSLARSPLTVEELEGWRDAIEKLASDFVAGAAGMDPREYPKTCEGCGLQALCRIQESRFARAEDEAEVVEAGDE